MIRATRPIAITLIMGLGGSQLSAQATPVHLDLKARKVDGALPFGEALAFRGDVVAKTQYVILRIGRAIVSDSGESIGARIGCGTWRRPPLAEQIPPSEFRIDLLPLQTLRPGKEYVIQVLLLEQPQAKPSELPLNPTGCGTNLLSSYKVTDSISIRARTDYEPKARFNADIGVLRTYRMGYVGATSNVHFSLVPLNSKENLANPTLTLREHFLRRFTFTVGLSLKELSSNEKVSQSTPAGSLLGGAAIRSLLYGPHQSRLRWLLEPMRIGANVIWLQQESANPIIDKKRNKLDLAAQLGFDVPLQQLFTPILSILTK